MQARIRKGIKFIGEVPKVFVQSPFIKTSDHSAKWTKCNNIVYWLDLETAMCPSCERCFACESMWINPICRYYGYPGSDTRAPEQKTIDDIAIEDLLQPRVGCRRNFDLLTVTTT